jgi:hypothetical protein
MIKNVSGQRKPLAVHDWEETLSSAQFCYFMETGNLRRREWIIKETCRNEDREVRSRHLVLHVSAGTQPPIFFFFFFFSPTKANPIHALPIRHAALTS